MSLWLVRAGRRGEREQVALDKGIITIGWEKMSDLSKLKDRNQLQRELESTYPESKKMQIVRYVSQLWTFSKEMKINDLVALPLKT
jgi:restriction system protein